MGVGHKASQERVVFEIICELCAMVERDDQKELSYLFALLYNHLAVEAGDGE